jgi:hypothetical protein
VPPLLTSRPVGVQVLLVAVVPVVYGFVTGVFLGTSAGVYIALNVLAAIGGYVAGLEHGSRGEAALRGVVGGTLFGGSILIGHEVTGSAAEVKLPEPAIVLLAFTIAGGVVLGLLGRATRARYERRQTV